MDTKDDEKNRIPFPEGYEHLEEMTRNAAKRARDLDERIKNIPTEDPRQTSYRLQYNPPGLARAQQRYQNRESREYLEGQKARNERELKKQMEPYLRHADPEDVARVKETVDAYLNPNPFGDMTPEQLERARGREKDLVHSQDFMRKRLDDFRKGRQPQPTGKTDADPAKKQPEKEDNKDNTLSSRYGRTLASCYLDNSHDIGSKPPTKGKEDRDRD